MPSILIVDDEANIRSTLKGALAREGYQVDDAPSVAGARTLLREAYDIVLLDVWFPGENGLDLLAEIRDDAPRRLRLPGEAALARAAARAAAKRLRDAGARERESAPARGMGHAARGRL